MNGASPLEIHRVITQPFGSNTYLLSRPGNPSYLLIDPGEGTDLLLADKIKGTDDKVEYVVLTHEHFDHLAGLAGVKRRWGCRVICSQACSDASSDPTRNFSRYLMQRDIVCKPADLCCEELGWTLRWNEAHLRFIPTPGHSPGGICIAVDGFLFTGDTLLPGAKRVSRLPGGNRVALENSITLLYTSFAPDTLVFPGHGEPYRLNCAGRLTQESALAIATR